MTKVEIIQSLKEAWSKALLDEKDLREDMAEVYAAWVQGLIQAAAPELSGAKDQQAAAQGGGEGQSMPAQGGGEGQAAPAGGQ